MTTSDRYKETFAELKRKIASARFYQEYQIRLFGTAWKKALQNTQQAVALIPETNMTSPAITQQDVAQFDEQTFLTSPLANISWSHHIILLDKVRDYKKAFWYMLNTIENGTSRNTLALQIESELFERQMKVKKMNNFSRTLPSPQSDFANYIMKDPYIFDFVQAKASADERNIELQLENQMMRFLLELGKGFAFVGRQIRVNIGDSDYFLDLLFYHLHMRCYVVIELNAKKFEPGDAGQLNFYINVVNDRFKTDHDQSTIGILFCKGKNEIMVENALTGYNQPMGISDYELSKIIPQDLQAELPSIEEIENSLSEP